MFVSFSRMFAVRLLSCLALCQTTLSEIVTYNWDVTWVWASPDGFGRPVIGINNQWPCPPMEVSSSCLLDSSITHVTRQVLGTESLSISTTSLGTKVPLCISMGYSRQGPVLWMDQQVSPNVRFHQVKPSLMTSL
jgi:hypothetical protein